MDLATSVVVGLLSAMLLGLTAAAVLLWIVERKSWRD